MLFPLLRICLCFLLPTMAMAQSIYVQSGEHANFSRLVIQVPKGKSWILDRVEDKVTLKLTGHRGGFDTSQIFNFIPKIRVKQITADESQLSLYLNCDCEVIAFAVQNSHVAIDITSPEPVYNPMVSRIPQLRPPSSPKLPSKNIKKSMNNTAEKITLPSIFNMSLKREEISIISDVQANLVRELRSATTRGVLEPEKIKSVKRAAHVDAHVFENVQNPIEDNPQISDEHAGKNIRISTSMDTLGQTGQTEISMSGIGTYCPSDEFLNIASWGDDRPFNEQISEARLTLFDELDKANSASIVKLARLYIYFGFGHEAKQVLKLSVNPSKELKIIQDISSIIEGEYINKENIFYTLSSCEGAAFLWSILANSKTIHSTGKPINALFPLNKLPIYLRKIVAPMLSNIFLIHGDTKNATTVLRNLERLADPLDPVAEVIQANINIEDGKTTLGVTQLENIISNSSAESPRALIALINSNLESKTLVNPENIELIESYANELQATEIGPELMRAYILSLINSGQFDRAISNSSLIDVKNKDKVAYEVRSYFLKELTRKSSSIVFSDIIFNHFDASFEQLDSTIKMSLASRLLDIGFTQHAHDIIQNIADKPVNETRQILAAQIALALGKPFQAQAELIGIDDSSALALLADAKQTIDAHEDAFALYRKIGSQEKAAQSAWLADSWRELVTSETPIFGALTELNTPSDLSSREPIGMLHRTKQAIDESAKARQVLHNILERSAITP